MGFMQFVRDHPGRGTQNEGPAVAARSSPPMDGPRERSVRTNGHGRHSVSRRVRQGSG